MKRLPTHISNSVRSTASTSGPPSWTNRRSSSSIERQKYATVLRSTACVSMKGDGGWYSLSCSIINYLPGRSKVSKRGNKA